MSCLLLVTILLLNVVTAFADDAERIAKSKIEGQVVFHSTIQIGMPSVQLTFEKKFLFIKVKSCA